MVGTGIGVTLQTRHPPAKPKSEEMARRIRIGRSINTVAMVDADALQKASRQTVR
jgi:hypothetical protein